MRYVGCVHLCMSAICGLPRPSDETGRSKGMEVIWVTMRDALGSQRCICPTMSIRSCVEYLVQPPGAHGRNPSRNPVYLQHAAEVRWFSTCHTMSMKKHHMPCATPTRKENSSTRPKIRVRWLCDRSRVSTMSSMPSNCNSSALTATKDVVRPTSTRFLEKDYNAKRGEVLQ